MMARIRKIDPLSSSTLLSSIRARSKTSRRFCKFTMHLFPLHVVLTLCGRFSIGARPLHTVYFRPRLGS
ncbi:hypothetical protein CC85DRAFT_203267 [Cutaneotrichosporon oleaginosum]|uniref:Uncharacterized protein n=1 Tax=Cutaneotrichosporon oleaginosum TaxID=879819 RepID=A0A0J1BA31_9TREE|nr:uncharacterized protein CC85DRAFT_203267 [Cutaneotrichosporon oleaginosum]KLT44744.1 hypothetical protein CC85DRAFT_203267 [Cutaneotrichosporon oleaginosum]TXT07730.1 hypothetical protein COLE_04654 [Cutaneotrichosporon oleaginosum]